MIDDVRVDDSLTLHVSFDKALDPTLPLQPALFRLQRADSSAGRDSTRVEWATAYDRARQAAVCRFAPPRADSRGAGVRVAPPPASGRAAAARTSAHAPPAGEAQVAGAGSHRRLAPLADGAAHADATYRITARGMPKPPRQIARGQSRRSSCRKPAPPRHDASHAGRHARGVRPRVRRRVHRA